MSAISPLSYTSTDNYGRITSFAGLNQSGDGYNVNLAYAIEGRNFDTSDGMLKPYRAGRKLDGDLPAPIGTLALLYRRWGAYSNPTLMIAAAGGKLYARTPDSTSWGDPIRTGLLSDAFDYVTYEVNVWDGQTLTDPVDVLLLSNAQDGMLCVRGDDLSVTAVETPKKFGVLARHAERIWGSGIPDDPDRLVYSAPFDPFDWEQNDEQPEDGAGDIAQPSWDGDSFVALRPFGSQLIAIKKKRVWRIIGTDPGTYVFKEQYGGGTVAENTVVVMNDRIMMLGEYGLMVYDGTDVSSFQNEAVQGVMARLNRAALDKATAAAHRDIYYLAVPLDRSAINNAVLIYNSRERTFNLIEGLYVRAFAELDTELLYTSGTDPYGVYSFGDGAVLPVEWKSGWQDMGLKNVNKNSFEVLLASDTGCELTLGIQTEKKRKEKGIYLSPGRLRRVRLSNKGRFWRLVIKAEGGVEPWRLIGGVQVMMELDYD